MLDMRVGRSTVHGAMRQMRILASTALICNGLLYAGLSAAADTEIYFADSSTNVRSDANVLFMFDSSGSMTEFDGTPDRRIDRLKQAMIDVVSSSSNVGIGIGAFNGIYSGGGILNPAMNVDTDLCPNASCTELDLRASVLHPTDDAHENNDGSVDLSAAQLDLDATVSDSSNVTVTYTIQSGADDAMQSHDSDNISIDSPAVELYYDAPSTSTALGETIAGYRFAGVSIPAGAPIVDARIVLTAKGVPGEGLGSYSSVRLENNVSAQAFADVDGQRISDRSLYPNEVVSGRLPYRNDGASVETDNLSNLVHQAVDDPAWSGSGDLAFTFERHSSSVEANDDSRRGFGAFESGDAAQLRITYSSATAAKSIIGLRFADLNIPRGATINHAVLEFTTQERGFDSSAVTIVGQDTADAMPFTSATNDLSNRMSLSARTTASVEWDAESITRADRLIRSSDISAVVKEIVDLPGWCGGNAMALMLDGPILGPGSSFVKSSEQNQWEAPTLRVNYSPASVDFNTTCVRQAISTTVASGNDDMMESSTDGALDGISDLLRTHVADDAQVIGLRFAQLDVPQGASITKAYIRMSSGGYVDGNVDLLINVENTDYANVYNSAVSNTISGRSYSGSGVSWQNVPEVGVGSTMRTPELKQLVESTVAKAGWNSGNAIAFVMSVASGSTGERLFNAFDSPADGATLVVHYQIDSTQLAGKPIVLHTQREELINTISDLNTVNATPLVDSYYEAAQYMLGGAVDFGKTRGEQRPDDRYNRISHRDSFTLTGGTVYRPPECSAFELNDVACVNEEIKGDAVYKQPAFGACQANQIVLLSDGAPTVNNSVSRIQTLTSSDSCDSASVPGEECGTELAEWLFKTDHDLDADGLQNIVTHTVGFNISTSFLRDMAFDGGGGFYPASSAADLAQAFKSIIDSSVSQGTSFVAPAASVSQTNRLVNSNDIYYGMFTPDTKTVWDGNLKRYQLAKNSTTGIVEVLDALAAPAVDAADGGISSTARSFWSSTVDGNDVSKGGAAGKLTLTRNLYVSLDDTSSELSTFHENTAGITDVLLGIEGADASYRTELLQWARGVDLKDFDADGNTTEVRTQMGDPLHSTQYLLNYKDSDEEEKGVIFLGTNHGFLHAINTDDGTEEFAYIPNELLSNLDYFYKDDIVSHDQRPHGLDGAITGWHDDANNNGFVDNNESAYVFVGMRRGGRNYYALDVSDLSAPEFKWVIKGGDGDFAELGQSWSRAVKAKVKYKGTSKDVLIFAGGYDPDKDSQVTRASDDEGAAIFIVDANSGDLVTSRTALNLSDMSYSIPSDIRVIDVDSDNLADMMLVGDTGGQLWRFDIDNSATTDLTFLTGGVIADLGNVGTTLNRRFFYEPDVALVRDESGKTFLNMGIGSGFRAHPNDVAVQDRFYAIRSPDIFGPPRNADGDISYSAVKVAESDLVDVTSVSGRLDTSGNISNGWYLTLSSTGEKVLSSALTIDNTLVFTTYVPSDSTANVCSVSLGSGRVYSVSALYGDPLVPPDEDESDENSGTALMTARYKTLRTPGIPPRVTGLITEAAPNVVTQIVGLESVGDADESAPFKRTFWAEQ